MVVSLCAGEDRNVSCEDQYAMICLANSLIAVILLINRYSINIVFLSIPYLSFVYNKVKFHLILSYLSCND